MIGFTWKIKQKLMLKISQTTAWQFLTERNERTMRRICGQLLQLFQWVWRLLYGHHFVSKDIFPSEMTLYPNTNLTNLCIVNSYEWRLTFQICPRLKICTGKEVGNSGKYLPTSSICIFSMRGYFAFDPTCQDAPSVWDMHFSNRTNVLLTHH